MKKTIQITEKELTNLIKESINELSPKLLSRAADKSGYLDNFEKNVKDALLTIENALDMYRDGKYWSDKGPRSGYDGSSPIYRKAENAINVLWDFFNRKHNQAENLNGAWYDAYNGMTDDEKDAFYEEGE